MVVFGVRARAARIVAAKPAAPPSSTSSRATLVMTACSRPRCAIASATRAGSSRIERKRLPRVDQAETAGTRAPIAEDHERRGAVGPAFVDVRAAGLLAHGVQVEVAHQPFRGAEAGAEVGAHPHPLRTARGRVGTGRDARLGEASEQAHRRAGVRRVERELGKVVGVFAPHDVLAFHHAVGEVPGEPRHDRVDDRPQVGRGSEHLRERRDTTIGDAARDDVVEHPEIGIDVERESVPGTATGNLHPTAAIFSSPTQTPG